MGAGCHFAGLKHIKHQVISLARLAPHQHCPRSNPKGRHRLTNHPGTLHWAGSMAPCATLRSVEPWSCMAHHQTGLFPCASAWDTPYRCAAATAHMIKTCHRVCRNTSILGTDSASRRAPMPRRASPEPRRCGCPPTHRRCRAGRRSVRTGRSGSTSRPGLG